MGEIAEMMIDGTMCQRCGEFLYDGEDGPGYAEFCPSCRRENANDERALQEEADARATQICDVTVEAIHAQFDAVFSPAILPQFRAQIFGLCRKLYLNRNGAISHHGMQRVVENNSAAMKRSAKKRPSQTRDSAEKEAK